MSTKRPNIVVMMADDHRFDAIAAHGDPTVKSPTMDQLIRDGVTFTRNWHCGSYSPAVCIPTRAALHTGTNSYQASLHKDMRDNLQNRNSPDIHTINPDRITLGEALRNNGYYTYMTGKWHNDGKSFNRSFCDGSRIFMYGMGSHYKVPTYEYDPTGNYDRANEVIHEGTHSSELFTDAAIKFINEYERDEPFYLNLAFTSPHDPRDAPQEYHDMYPAKDMAIPTNFKEPDFDQGHARIRDEVLAAFPRDENEIKQHIADYYAMITHQNVSMQKVLDTLEQRGMLENTIVVYTADHGLAVGQHGLMGKQNMYEHSLRVPLIMTGPGIPKGLRCCELTQTPDLFPTLMALTDTPCPATVTAKSLVPLMQGEDSLRKQLFSRYFDLQRSVRDSRYKLIRYYKQQIEGSDQTPGCDKVQFFDLQRDPWETQDRYGSAEYQAVIEHLADALKAHMDEHDDALKDVPILI
ncbi:MAG TPA: sulfatase [Phycisphaerales bacterium]|nr:sulfatase [Phycisphaerales bacterium]HCD33736.1 sulfatase [Phycisphaerales bacterium]|tara:strand:+ start:241 stop:1635 length:1395 start_codon:yes stop_codon:yes gene_type:complete